ncbi:acetyltransferase [Vibrio cholerae]|nr:acetyltransferase [Vibrio cholerae]
MVMVVVLEFCVMRCQPLRRALAFFARMSIDKRKCIVVLCNCSMSSEFNNL